MHEATEASRCRCAFCRQKVQRDKKGLCLPIIVRCDTVDAILYNSDGRFMWYFPERHDQPDCEGFREAFSAAFDMGARSNWWWFGQGSHRWVFGAQDALMAHTDFSRVSHLIALLRQSPPCSLTTARKRVCSCDEATRFVWWLTQSSRRMLNYVSILRSEARVDESISDLISSMRVMDTNELALKSATRPQRLLRCIPLKNWNIDVIENVTETDPSSLHVERVFEEKPIPCPIPRMKNTWKRRQMLCRLKHPVERLHFHSQFERSFSWSSQGRDEKDAAYIDVWLSDTLFERRVHYKAPAFMIDAIDVCVPDDAPDDRIRASTDAYYVDVFSWLRLDKGVSVHDIRTECNFLRRLHGMTDLADNCSFDGIMSLDKPAISVTERLAEFCREWDNVGLPRIDVRAMKCSSGGATSGNRLSTLASASVASGTSATTRSASERDAALDSGAVGADKSGADKSGADKSGADKSGADKSGADKSGAAGEKSSAAATGASSAASLSDADDEALLTDIDCDAAPTKEPWATPKAHTLELVAVKCIKHIDSSSPCSDSCAMPVLHVYDEGATVYSRNLQLSAWVRNVPSSMMNKGYLSPHENVKLLRGPNKCRCSSRAFLKTKDPQTGAIKLWNEFKDRKRARGD